MDKVKRVKRKAKAGEYIELVRERHTIDVVGDILRVSSVNEVENYIEVNRDDLPKAKEANTAVTVLIYTHDDYVVLEGYEPRTVPIPLTEQLKNKVSELEEINATLLERVENLDAENADRERLARENKELREQVEELTNHHSEMARIIDGLQTEALTQYERYLMLKGM